MPELTAVSALDRWTYRGQERPPFAEAPGPGEESVWDYPRPPAIRADAREVRVEASGQLLALTRRAVRVLETASPPTFYLPIDDIDMTRLIVMPGSSFCEWKGQARYYRLDDGASGVPVAWDYPQPTQAFIALANHVSFYPARLACQIDGEQVTPQPGEFYGGWMTAEIVGPVKGMSGSEGW